MPSLEEASATRKAINKKKAKKKTKPRKAKVKPKVVSKPKDTGLTKIGQEKGISAGRPKGAKNKTTLMKEVYREGLENVMMEGGVRVIEVVLEKAVGGDLAACKIVLDRLYPVVKAVDIDAVKTSGTKGITINIEQLVASVKPSGDTIEDGVVIDE